ncbi:MAG: hypothetical protein R2708_17385 [Vicinamibacterales bacterium]
MAQRLVKPGLLLQSRLLTHPLDRSAGGDSFHGGGKHWLTQADPEWQALAAWVRGSATFPTAAPATLPPGTAIRIVQTNAAGDGAHLIGLTTNRVTLDPGRASRFRTASPRRPMARGRTRRTRCATRSTWWRCRRCGSPRACR